MAYIGIGNSIGLAMDVPILVRSLGASFALLEEDTPMFIDLDFKLVLDMDFAGQNPKCQLVERYDRAWWKKKAPQNLDRIALLDASSVDKCLETHFSQIISTINEPDDPLEGKIIGAGSSETSMSVGPIGPEKHLISKFAYPESAPDVSAKKNCRDCLLYAKILNDSLRDLLNVHSYANSMATSHEAQWQFSMRRASTFNLLYEAAVVKETADSISATVPKRKRERIAFVAENAKNDLLRLQALPPSSHKWTWGEGFSEEEVLGLGRSGTNPKINFHSGYDKSLRPGNMPADNSSPPSMPKSLESSKQINVPSENLPDYTFPEIKYFKEKQNLFYDPLGKRKAEEGNSESEEVIEEGIEDIWESDKDSSAADFVGETSDIADVWESANEEDPPQISSQAYRHFGPEDFSHLREEMFEVSSGSEDAEFF